jgi:hypothetical protein
MAASASAARGYKAAVTPMAVAVFNASRRVMGWSIMMESSLIAFQNRWIAATDAPTLPRAPPNHKTVRIVQKTTRDTPPVASIPRKTGHFYKNDPQKPHPGGFVFQNEPTVFRQHFVV